MGLLTFLGGVLTTIGSWVMKAVPVVLGFAKKIGSWISGVSDLTNSYNIGKDIFIDSEIDNKKIRGKYYKYSDSDDNSSKELYSKMIRTEQALELHKDQTSKEHKKLILQLKVVEAVIASQTFERFANNIRIHEANLNIHFQNIINISGILDQVNRIKTGIKATMKVVNQLVYKNNIKAKNSDDKISMIRDIDVDSKKGAISIYKSYQAFINTISILKNEVNLFLQQIEIQTENAAEIYAFANEVPEKKKKIQYWIDQSLNPQLIKCKKMSLDIIKYIDNIPLIDNIDVKKEINTLSLKKSRTVDNPVKKQ